MVAMAEHYFVCVKGEYGGHGRRLFCVFRLESSRLPGQILTVSNI